MAGFFSYESKFTQGMNKFVDIVVLSALWFVFSIPVFTIGTSTTALFTAVRRCLRENKGYSYSTFWSAFKSNFKLTVPIWLLQLLIFVVLYFDRQIILNLFAAQGSSIGTLHIVFLFLMFYELIWIVYTCAYASRFEMNRRGIMKNAAILSVAHLPWSALMIVMLIAAWLLIRFISPVFMFLFPALYGWIFTIILERIFRRYMTPEDLKKVEEEEKQNDL